MKKQTGLTLIELIVTMAVLGIVLASALPSMNGIIDSNRRSANINLFVGSLNLARSEAVKRNNSVSLCTSSSGTACDNTLSWEDGWLVFVDIDGDGVVDAGDGDSILRVFEKLHKRTTPNKDITLIEAEAALKKITYRFKGDVDNQATFVHCDDTTDKVLKARAIIVSNTGRVRLSQGNKQRDNATTLVCP